MQKYLSLSVQNNEDTYLTREELASHLCNYTGKVILHTQYTQYTTSSAWTLRVFRHYRRKFDKSSLLNYAEKIGFREFDHWPGERR